MAVLSLIHSCRQITPIFLQQETLPITLTGQLAKKLALSIGSMPSTKVLTLLSTCWASWFLTQQFPFSGQDITTNRFNSLGSTKVTKRSTLLVTLQVRNLLHITLMPKTESLVQQAWLTVKLSLQLWRQSHKTLCLQAPLSRKAKKLI